MDFATARTSLELNRGAINVDKYAVLQRWSCVIGPNRFEDGVGDIEKSEAPTHKYIKKWIPFKRQMRFDETGAVPESGNWFLVYWADQLGNQASATAAVASAYKIQYKILQYFKDPK